MRRTCPAGIAAAVAPPPQPLARPSAPLELASALPEWPACGVRAFVCVCVYTRRAVLFCVCFPIHCHMRASPQSSPWSQTRQKNWSDGKKMKEKNNTTPTQRVAPRGLYTHLCCYRRQRRATCTCMEYARDERMCVSYTRVKISIGELRASTQNPSKSVGRVSCGWRTQGASRNTRGKERHKKIDGNRW